MPDRERVTPKMSVREILAFLRETPGYFLTNNERDVSQSDFKCRILPRTTLRVAPYRDDTGYFAFEISGGASVHLDLMNKQINPFEKLRLVKKRMPHTLIQTVCRGRNLFGYRPYPDNVLRMTVRLFARYIDVWRVYDFLNHVPNLEVVGREVQEAGRLLMPCICFNTGVGHTDEYYVAKVGEILDTFGDEIILGIKNHSAVGSPRRIASLVAAIKARYPELILAYHGHNTDGNDLGRMVAAVENGVKIVEVADHGFGGMYSQAPALSLIQTLNDDGYKAPGLKVQPIVDASDLLRRERRHYERFETPFRGFDPTVKRHKLTGGAASIAFEQAEKLGLLERIHEIFSELMEVNRELGNIWSVTPGSQILWSTAVSNVIYGRYENPTDDLKNLLLGRYGPFPFYEPQQWIYEKVLEHRRRDGKKWYQILADEAGIQDLPDVDLDARKRDLEEKLRRPATDEELCLYVQFPKDALDYFRFEDTFGKAWLLPPQVWYRRGGFRDGETIRVPDEEGRTHQIDVVSTHRKADEVETSLLVDFHFQTYSVPLRKKQ
ncbi:pyruvate carboxylase [Desulfacinum infernum DSM 9756]|uniref:Pyruvate carboxylase n=1 Tax=Desulfacinum infernum DSM 9756 TaxID=1121391 RepID=A0A1M5ARM8_9BACT|nr:pyruvate carboxylase [Desulfacinum infernum]SHF32845.1 pyruvate carboxylase [Desulfacinum infernum DSM 9756]